MKKARKCTPVYDKGSNSDKGRERDKSVYLWGQLICCHDRLISGGIPKRSKT